LHKKELEKKMVNTRINCDQTVPKQLVEDSTKKADDKAQNTLKTIGKDLEIKLKTNSHKSPKLKDFIQIEELPDKNDSVTKDIIKKQMSKQ
jgi:hypothetical protein